MSQGLEWERPFLQFALPAVQLQQWAALPRQSRSGSHNNRSAWIAPAVWIALDTAAVAVAAAAAIAAAAVAMSAAAVAARPWPWPRPPSYDHMVK